MMMPERDDTRARECGDVHHDRRLEALRIGERIAQDEPAFGVSVENLDRLARHAGDHVARLDRGAARHVLARRDDAHEVELGLQFRHGAQRAEHARRATHIELHLVHFTGGFDRNAAGIESDALAHQHNGCHLGAGAVVVRDDEAQRFVRALRDGKERAHAELFNRLAVQHFDLAAVFLAELLCLARKVGRRAMVAGAVRTLACQQHAIGDRLAAFQPQRNRLCVGLAAQQAHLCQLGRSRRARLGVAVDIGCVVNRRDQRLGVRVVQLHVACDGHGEVLGATVLQLR